MSLTHYRGAHLARHGIKIGDVNATIETAVAGRHATTDHQNVMKVGNDPSGRAPGYLFGLE